MVIVLGFCRFLLMCVIYLCPSYDAGLTCTKMQITGFRFETKSIGQVRNAFLIPYKAVAINSFVYGRSLMKHLLSACKINQCDNELVTQIILTWFEIDHTGYISYLFSLQFFHRRGWPCETTSARSHTCTASVPCMTLFARTQYEKRKKKKKKKKKQSTTS